jgi:D-aspartate ligase
MENPPAVVLGGGVIALATARALGSGGVPVIALGSARMDSVRRSRFCAQFIDVGSGTGVEERFIDWLTTAPGGAVVLPCSDDALWAVAVNRPTLEDCGHRLPEAKDDVVLAMLDKQKAYELARAAGFATPSTLIIRDRGDLARAKEIGFPCALKPVHSHLFARHFGLSKKVLVAHDDEELRSAFDAIASLGIDVLLTEIIPGRDDDYHSVLTYMTEEQEPLFLVTKRKVRQYPPEFGLGSYHLTDWDPGVADLAVALCRAIGLVGIANFEFKRDARDGSLKLIECNHRLTITSELVRLAGINSARIVYDRALGLVTGGYDSYERGVRLLLPTEDMRASLALRRKGHLTLASWARSVLHRQHFVVFRWSDPGPAILAARMRGQRVAARVVSRLRVLRQTVGAADEIRAPGSPRGAKRRDVAGLEVQDGLTRATWALGKRGKLGREVAVRIDMVRATGPGHAWRRGLEQARRLRLSPGGDVIANVYRGIWTDAAHELGAVVEDLPGGGLEIRNGASSTRVWGKSVAFYDEQAVALADDKRHVHEVLSAAGVPVPDFCEFEIFDLGEALALVRETGGTWVVKPAAGAGGYGVTCGVRTADHVVRAAVRASRHTSRLLIERQVSGDFYRFLTLDGEILGIVRRRPPRVTGDGRSTVEKLIFDANRRRAEARIALQPTRIDLDCVLTLEVAGLSLDTVVPAGVDVVVKSVVSQNRPRDNEIVLERIDDGLRADVVKAARLLDLRLAGVDLITPTLDAALAASGGAIIEVNGAPGLHYHYEVAAPWDPDRVAVPILRKLLAEPVAAAVESGNAGENAVSVHSDTQRDEP